MKKSILAAVLLLATVAAHAVTMSSSQAKVTVDPATSIGTWQVVDTNPSGTPQPTPFPGGQQTVLNGISGTAATSYFDKLTAAAAASATSAKQDTAFGAQTTTAAVLAGVATAANQALAFGSQTTTAAAIATAANQALAFGFLTTTAAAESYFAMNPVTYASGVAGTSMQYLTLSTKSSLFIDNTTTGTLYFVLHNSATPPVNTATIRLSVPTLQQLNLNMANGTLAQGYNFLHWINANTLTPTARQTY